MLTGDREGRSSRPLRYARATVDGMQVLAHDPSGAGRIVEVFGNLDHADHLAIVVPGNGHDLATYRHHTGSAAPRRNGSALHHALRDLTPWPRCAVIVWLGYACPRGLGAVSRRAAGDGARDLRRLVRWLPPAVRITAIGHSYGSLVVAAAATGDDRIDDVVALASPGLGVRHVSELATGARVWATRHPRDPIRYVPRVRIGGFGHGRQPTDPAFGARVFASDATGDHATYYRGEGETLRNLVRIVAGRHEEVNLPGARRQARAAWWDAEMGASHLDDVG